MCRSQKSDRYNCPIRTKNLFVPSFSDTFLKFQDDGKTKGQVLLQVPPRGLSRKSFSLQVKSSACTTPIGAQVLAGLPVAFSAAREKQPLSPRARHPVHLQGRCLPQLQNPSFPTGWGVHQIQHLMTFQAPPWWSI